MIKKEQWIVSSFRSWVRNYHNCRGDMTLSRLRGKNFSYQSYGWLFSWSNMHARVLLYPTDFYTKGRTFRKLHQMVGSSTKFAAKRALFADSNKILFPLAVLSERKVSMKIFFNTFAATCGHIGDVCPKKWSSLDKSNDIFKKLDSRDFSDW